MSQINRDLSRPLPVIERQVCSEVCAYKGEPACHAINEEEPWRACEVCEPVAALIAQRLIAIHTVLAPIVPQGVGDRANLRELIAGIERDLA